MFAAATGETGLVGGFEIAVHLTQCTHLPSGRRFGEDHQRGGVPPGNQEQRGPVVGLRGVHARACSAGIRGTEGSEQRHRLFRGHGQFPLRIQPLPAFKVIDRDASAGGLVQLQQESGLALLEDRLPAFASRMGLIDPQGGLALLQVVLSDGAVLGGVYPAGAKILLQIAQFLIQRVKLGLDLLASQVLLGGLNRDRLPEHPRRCFLLVSRP